MSKPPVHELSPRQRRRLIIVGLLRAAASTVFVLAMYYLLPLDSISGDEVAIALLAGLGILGGVVTFQVRRILKAAYPGIRAVQALATTAPLFLVLFAATYFLVVRSTSGSFNVSSMTRTDALYFTTTVFATVGFGDIAPVSQSARLLVTTQMILDLLILGFGVRVFFGAVQVARTEKPAQTTTPVATELVEEIDPESG